MCALLTTATRPQVKHAHINDSTECSCASHAAGAQHHHTKHVSSISLSSASRLDQVKLRQWLQTTIDAHWKDLFRIKGILYVDSDRRRFVVQGVHAELIGDFDDTLDDHAEPDQVSRIVFIGLHLEHTKLQAGFEACIHEAADTPPATVASLSLASPSDAAVPAEHMTSNKSQETRRRRRVD